jgi:nucleoside-diphosphate-sugar epimerase
MKALITGGAGFVGSHLAEALLRRGDAVTVIDNLSTGTRDNVAHLQENNRFQLVVDSVMNDATLVRLVADADAVFHLASAVGVKLIIDRPVETIESIVEGTARVLRHARRHGRRVLITSTSEVYGKGSRIPFGEHDDVVLGPTDKRRWAYACSKMVGEFLALAHWYETQLPVVCVRLFNTVGPRQTGQYGMVLPRFVQQALWGEPITVYGDGTQTRCFCHVADVVDALVKLMDCHDARGLVVNIGSDEEVTISRLAERVRTLTGSPSPIVTVPYDQAYVAGFEDMQRRVPDLAMARRLIGYKPTHSLDDIIGATVAFWSGRPRPQSVGP